MRTLLLALSVFSLAHAQLVPTPAPAPAQSASPRRSHAASPSKPKPHIEEPDLNDQLGLPKRFVGAIIDKKTNSMILSVIGTWGPAPEIQGSSSTVKYSKLGARLSDFLTQDETTRYLYSFNIGQKNGRLLVRTFRWPSQSYGLVSSTPVVQEDEGEGSSRDGRFEFETEKQRIVIRAADEGRWAPKEIHLFHWIASDVQGTKAPKRASMEGWGADVASQWVPTWAGGSYLVLSDGFMGKAFFHAFGGTTTFEMAAAATGDEIHFGPPFHQEGNMLLEGGYDRLSEWWQGGLRIFGQSSMPGGSLKTSFRFRKGWGLTDLSIAGRENEGTTSYTSSMAGTSEEVPVEARVRDEVLDRSREAEWPMSAGPYSLKRVLLNAFKNCTLVGPRVALSTDSYRGDPTYAAKVFNQRSVETYKSALAQWREDAESAGATLKLVEPDAPDPVQRPVPTGWILPPGAPLPQVKEGSGSISTPASVGSVPDPSDPQTLPPIPTAKGAYVLSNGTWSPLPHNNGHIHQSIFSALGTIQSGSVKLGELIFDGTEQISEVPGEKPIFLLGVGERDANTESLLQKGGISSYPGVEVARLDPKSLSVNSIAIPEQFPHTLHKRESWGRSSPGKYPMHSGRRLVV